MGGIGSGHHVRLEARNTTEDLHRLDLNTLRRDGLLTPGLDFDLTWRHHERVLRVIHVEVEPERLFLSHPFRMRDGDFQITRYPVPLTTTPCGAGGERTWFQCPVPGCGRRVGALYGGPLFACRHSYRLAYPSQRARPWERAARRANRIRSRLGWTEGILVHPERVKPRGMHWRTFFRLQAEHDALVDTALQGIDAQLRAIRKLR